MTVIELIHELNKYPSEMQVFVAERKTEFAYGLVNSVISKTINIKEDPYDDEVLAIEQVLIIDEE